MQSKGYAKKVRALNDAFRRNPHQGGGRLVLTAGMIHQGQEFVQKCFATLRHFDAWDDGNDPWGRARLRGV
jgi:hypothetical protein